jgi:glycosyltransferase involved in cell wall biosynthesis
MRVQTPPLLAPSTQIKPPRSQRWRIRAAGRWDATIAPGGGEVQLAQTIAQLAAAGYDARQWRPWEDPLADFDLLHLFGASPEYLPLIRPLQNAGKQVVLSPIAWHAPETYWHDAQPFPRRVAALAKHYARRQLPTLPDWRRQLYSSVDLLLPNSQAEAEQLLKLYGVQPRRIQVVPNGAAPHFHTATPDRFIDRYGISNFVLVPGRIEPRKNQLRLLAALRGSGLPVVVLGDPVPQHADYSQQCRRAADGHVIFLPRIAPADPLLASAFAAARCLVLPSLFETPGLVALEAALQGLPLVLPTWGSACEYFGPLATYVTPTDLRQLRAATLHAFTQPRSPQLVDLVLQNFTWQRVAQRTLTAYDTLVKAPA